MKIFMLGMITTLVACSSSGELEGSENIEFDIVGSESQDCAIEEVTSAVRMRSDDGPMGFTVRLNIEGNTDETTISSEDFILYHNNIEIDFVTDEITADAENLMLLDTSLYRDEVLVDRCSGEQCYDNVFSIFLRNFYDTQDTTSIYRLVMPAGSIICNETHATEADYVIPFTLMAATI